MAMGERVKKFQVIERIARRKLLGNRAASRLEDLAAHPGNSLDALKGTVKASTASASMTGTESALHGGRIRV